MSARRAHAFTASRVSEQADVTEIDLAHEIIQSGRWSFGAGVPPAELLQMTEHQTSPGKVQAAITENAGCSVDAAVRIEGNNDVAKTRQTLCQVTVSGVTRHGNKAGRTRAGKRVLNIDIKMLSGPSQSTGSIPAGNLYSDAVIGPPERRVASGATCAARGADRSSKHKSILIIPPETGVKFWESSSLCPDCFNRKENNQMAGIAY